MLSFNEFLVQEEYLFNLKNIAGKDSGFGVYKNPSSSDLGKLRKSMAKGDTEVRFMADSKTKSVFVWNASSHIHSQVAKDLMANKAIDTLNFFNVTDFFSNTTKLSDIDVTRFFNGTAELSGGSLIYKHSDTIDSLMKILTFKSKPSGMDQKTYDSVKSLATTIKNNANALSSIFSFVNKYIDGATTMFEKIK